MYSPLRASRAGCKLPAPDPNVLVLQDPLWAEVWHKEDSELTASAVREELLAGALSEAERRAESRRARSAAAEAARAAVLRAVALCELCVPRGEPSAAPDSPPRALQQDAWARCELPVCSAADLPPEPRSFDLASPPESARAKVIDIPEHCWFPGRVCLMGQDGQRDHVCDECDEPEPSGQVLSVSGPSRSDSEQLQRVTEYGDTLEKASKSSVTAKGNLDITAPCRGVSGRAGLSRRRTLPPLSLRPKKTSTTKVNVQRSMQTNPIRRLSDCQLRGHRWETQYEVSAEQTGDLKQSRETASNNRSS